MPRLRGAVAALLLPLALFYGVCPAADPAGEKKATPVLSVRRDSFFYAGDEKAFFTLSLNNPNEKAFEGADLLFKLYQPCRRREELAEVREGKSRLIVHSFYLRRGMKLEPGLTEERFSLDLASIGVSNGAWPFRVELIQGGKKEAETRGYLLISRLQSGLPLLLVPLWDVHYPPLRDARGGELDGSLAAACSSAPEDKGFLFSLLRAMKMHHGVRSAVALPGQTAEQIEVLARDDLSGGAGEGAAQLLESLKGLVKDGRLELLSSTFGYADLGQLEELGWREDMEEQILRGGNSLAVLVEGSAPGGFFPPLYSMHPLLPALLGKTGLSYTLTTETYVSAAQRGEQALAEVRSGYPIYLSDGKGGGVESMVVDGRLFQVLENWDEDADREGMVVIDDILAETLLFQGEKPTERRICLLSFPASFRPTGEVLDHLYSALELAPWLETSLPREALSLVPARSLAALELERVFEEAPPYLSGLEEKREKLLQLREVQQEGEPLRETLYAALMTGEGADLYEGYPEGIGQRFLESLGGWIENELSGIKIRDQGTLTLSGTQGEITVFVSNVNAYPVRARLELSARGVDFPQGNLKEVIIEPRENTFSFPVATQGKGGFLVDIVLYLGDLKVSEVTVNLRTSNINTLAMIFLAVVLFLIALSVALRKMRHWGRRGRHEHA